MKDQLPTPILELIVLHIYLSSITLILGLVILYFLLRFKNLATWKSYLIFSIASIVFGIIGSFLIWVIWPFSFDIMFGPLNIPMGLVLIVLLSLITLKPAKV